MATPRIGKLTGTVTWSDATNFNGFAVICLVLPTSAGSSWPGIAINPNFPRQPVPLRATIPISNGVFNQQCGLWYNEDLDPPNTKYTIYYLDTMLNTVGSPSSSADFFTIAANLTSPPMYTLTAPTAGTAIPTLGDY